MKKMKEVTALTCCLSLMLPLPAAFAAPQGGKVAAGSATIRQSGHDTIINQNSNRAVINWQAFDIGKNEALRHNMPSADSAGLHRVVGGGGASRIEGLLQSNGNVYVVNPAGVVIHKGGRVDTGGFVATTRDIADSDFMKGNMVFDKPGLPGAAVVNQGVISVKESGLAALVAPTVRNEGLIAGRLGKVTLASGDTAWKLDMHGDDLITFTVNEEDVNALHAADGTPLAAVENSGTIRAEGGVVVLTAAQLDGIVSSVVNSGEVLASSAGLKGGKITFRGEGSGVDIVNTGTVDASSAVADGGSVRMDTDGTTRSSGVIAATGGQQGGKVVVTGKNVALTGRANIDVSGNKGGGTALVGGNARGRGPERSAETTKVEKGATIVADAREKGDGGQVVVWSEEKTNVDGSLSAKGGSKGGNGGMVETSGRSLKVGDTARVDTLAPQGRNGAWLLDPVDFVIAESGGDISGETLSANLERGDVRIESVNGVRDGRGDIFVNSAVSWNADTTLALDAERNIYVNADITAAGDHAGLNLSPAGDYVLGEAKITLSGADPRLSIKGEGYIVIHDVHELQNINKVTAFDNNYALGVDIDAGSAAGFMPIGLDAGFSGIFDGMGHTIDSLTIAADDDFFATGLFSVINSTGVVRNVTLTDASIDGGGEWTGAVAGVSHGYVHHVSAGGQAEGYMSAGGIVGLNQGAMEQAFSDVDVSCAIVGGGLVGENAAGATISCSGSTGSVYGDGVGGFAGSNKGEISFSYSSGLVEEAAINSGNSNGGFVGTNSGNIADSYSLSDIRADSGNRAWGTGGFAGELLGGTLSRVYWSGTISSKDGKPIGSYAGAIAGYIPKQWNEGFVSINAAYGLDSGCAPDQSGVEYENIHGIGKLELAPGEYYISSSLLTAEQMKSRASFQGWDFERVWAIDEGQSSPSLRPVAVVVPGPSPDPDPGIDPDPTPDPEPGQVWPSFNPDPDSDIDPVLPEHDRIQEVSRGLNQSIGAIADGLTSIVDFSQDYLPDVFINVLKKKLMINVSGSLISSISQFLAGNPTSFLKELAGLVKDVFDPELIDIVLRMKWTSDCLNKSEWYIEQARNDLNKNTNEGTISAIENIKKAHEYKNIALILAEQEYEDVLERSEKTFFENAMTHSGEVVLSIGENILDDLASLFAGPAVREAITETNGIVAGISAEFLLKHGKDLVEFEELIMTGFEIPDSLKAIVENMDDIKAYDTMLQKLSGM